MESNTMKGLKVVISVLILALAVAGCAKKAEMEMESLVTGRWKMEIDGPGGAEELIVDLLVEGETVTVVTAEHNQFGSPQPGAAGTINGDKLQLKMTYSTFGDLVEFTFDGTVADGTMSGVENFNPLGPDPNAPKTEKKEEPKEKPEAEGAGGPPKDIAWKATKM